MNQSNQLSTVVHFPFDSSCPIIGIKLVHYLAVITSLARWREICFVLYLYANSIVLHTYTHTHTLLQQYHWSRLFQIWILFFFLRSDFRFVFDLFCFVCFFKWMDWTSSSQSTLYNCIVQSCIVQCKSSSIVRYCPFLSLLVFWYKSNNNQSTLRYLYSSPILSLTCRRSPFFYFQKFELHITTLRYTTLHCDSNWYWYYHYYWYNKLIQVFNLPYTQNKTKQQNNKITNNHGTTSNKS